MAVKLFQYYTQDSMAKLTDRIIKRVGEVESTNDIALDLGVKGAVAGTIVVADSQSKGRGRLRRQWFSPPGEGLYFSMIYYPNLSVADLPKITLAVGVAVCEAVERECRLVLGIKWPNDLLFEGKKIGGILCETGPVTGDEPTGGILAVLGIGLNVSTSKTDFPGSLSGRAASLANYTRTEIDKELLLIALADKIDNAIILLENNQFDSILMEWKKRDVLIGRTLSWVTGQGDVVTGTAVGIDANGLYHIRSEDGRIHDVISGDIEIAGKSD